MLFLLAASPARALFRSSDAGTSTAQFLKLGAGARAAGMGEAYSAVADEATALYWNPGALARVRATSLVAQHSALLGGSSYDYLGFAQKLDRRGVFGLGLQSLSVPAIQETDSAGFATGGSIKPRDMAVSAGYAHPSLPLLEDYSFGFSAKYISSKVVRSASAFAVDIGLLSPNYGVWGETKTRLALVCQNLGSAMKFSQDKEPLPLNLKFGAAFEPYPQWTIALDANLPGDNRPYAALGAEIRTKAHKDFGYAGRVGFNSRTVPDVPGFSAVSFGVGFRYRRFQVDYAFHPLGALGNDHQASFSLEFGGESIRATRFEERGAVPFSKAVSRIIPKR